MSTRTIRFSGLGLIALALVSLGSAAFAGGPKVCPDIWAPVICSNGKVYPNQCYADKSKAKGCVPYGDIQSARPLRTCRLIRATL